MKTLASCFAVWFAGSTLAAAPDRLYVGTYTDTTSRGIYSLSFDSESGRLSNLTLAATTKDPAYLVLDPSRRHLYAGAGVKGGVSAYGIDRATGSLTLLNRDPAVPGGLVSHLVVDNTGRMLLVAGNTPTQAYVYDYPLGPDGALGPRGPLQEERGPPGPNLPRQAHAHAHCVTLSADNRFALVCNMGIDRIFVYRIFPDEARIAPDAVPAVSAPPGAGPRHGKFSPDGRFFDTVNQMNGSVSVYAYDTSSGRLSLRQTLSTLPSDFQGKNDSSEIAISPDGRHVYAANRGPDTLTVFDCDSHTGELSVIDRLPCGGREPRFFTLSPDGRWLLCANQNSDSIAVFRVDSASGRLTPCGLPTAVPRPICIVFD